jgi:hypothetical protein
MVPCRSADTTPVPTPTTSQITAAPATRENVTGIRLAISDATDACC